MKNKDFVESVGVYTPDCFKHKSEKPDLFVYLPAKDPDPLMAEIPQLKKIQTLIEEIRKEHPVRKVEILFDPTLIDKDSVSP